MPKELVLIEDVFKQKDFKTMKPCKHLFQARVKIFSVAWLQLKKGLTLLRTIRAA
jgi:hypothetical protein